MLLSLQSVFSFVRDAVACAILERMAVWIFLRTSSSEKWSLYKMFSSLWQHLISKASILLINSAVKVHDSQAYRNKEMTRTLINFTSDTRDVLSLQISISFLRAAVACAILEKLSGLESSIETTAPRYLKCVTVPSIFPFTWISLYMRLALFIISLVLSALISIVNLVLVLSRLSTRASCFCSPSA